MFKRMMGIKHDNGEMIKVEVDSPVPESECISGKDLQRLEMKAAVKLLRTMEPFLNLYRYSRHALCQDRIGLAEVLNIDVAHVFKWETELNYLGLVPCYVLISLLKEKLKEPVVKKTIMAGELTKEDIGKSFRIVKFLPDDLFLKDGNMIKFMGWTIYEGKRCQRYVELGPKKLQFEIEDNVCLEII